MVQTQPWKSELILALCVFGDFLGHLWCVAAPLPTPSRYLRDTLLNMPPRRSQNLLIIL